MKVKNIKIAIKSDKELFNEIKEVWNKLEKGEKVKKHRENRDSAYFMVDIWYLMLQIFIMPRITRVVVKGCFHHVMQRGNYGQARKNIGKRTINRRCPYLNRI